METVTQLRWNKFLPTSAVRRTCQVMDRAPPLVMILKQTTKQTMMME